MRCVTWSRDSHGLFDYESKSIVRNEYKTWTSGTLCRDPTKGISFENPNKEKALIEKSPEQQENG